MRREDKAFSFQPTHPFTHALTHAVNVPVASHDINEHEVPCREEREKMKRKEGYEKPKSIN